MYIYIYIFVCECVYMHVDGNILTSILYKIVHLMYTQSIPDYYNIYKKINYVNHRYYNMMYSKINENI